MKIAYFDCFAGISGDMILGALVDAGLPLDQLQAALNKLGVLGFKLSAARTVKNGITGTKVSVHTEEQKAHRHLRHINEIIDGGSLSERTRQLSKAVFEAIARAEAKVHNTTVEKIHFHEVGALDAIVDIVGSVVGLEMLGVEAVYASRVHVGTGFVDCAHGRIPVPAPATLEILQGAPTFSEGIEAELTTPTGAAVVTTLAGEFGAMPPMKVEAIGYGAGSRDLPIPNMLRLVIGSAEEETYQRDRVSVIESNIDDMNPELYDYVLERLFAAGALDAFLEPLIMKKNRPGVGLTVLVDTPLVDVVLKVLFEETSTLGVRLQQVERRKLPREVIRVTTDFGEIGVKVARLGERVRDIAPEYDDCRKAAARHQVPLRLVYEAARKAAGEWLAEHQ
jgi:uncharacterized protein (TIGR00299 family) protein